MKSLKHSAHIPLFCLLTLSFFSSCLDINANILIRRNGTVDLELEYIMEAQGAEFGRGFGADDPWPLPLTEKDFRLATLRHPGISLQDYQSKSISEDRERIRVKLRAESFQTLSEYLGWDMIFENRESSQVLEIRVAAINPQVRHDTRDMLKSLIGDSRFSIRIKGFGKPESVNGGQIEGSTALFSNTLSSLVFLTEPLLWSVSW